MSLPSALRINLQGDGLHIHDEYDLSSKQLDLFYFIIPEMRIAEKQRGILQQCNKMKRMQ